MRNLVKYQIEELIKKGAVQTCQFQEDQFISKIFSTPKPDGSSRLILNLKRLNVFVETKHFKLEDIRTAKNLMYKGCFMITLDLKDAYYLVPVAQKHRKYLRFSFLNELYEFTVLPFGLSCAPYVFTKIMKPIVTYLRKLGFISVIYLDDLLLIGENYIDCLNNCNQTILILESLCFIINMQKKSKLIPSTICQFLGIELNSRDMLLQHPQEKRKHIHQLITKYSNLRKCKIRNFSSFIGSLCFCCQASTYGWVYVKEFERQKIQALERKNNDYDEYMEIKNVLRESFVWWKSNIFKINNLIRSSKFSVEIFSDSSTSGWGAHCQGKESTVFGKSKNEVIISIT